jgi:hypothetical protein
LTFPVGHPDNHMSSDKKSLDSRAPLASIVGIPEYATGACLRILRGRDPVPKGWQGPLLLRNRRAAPRDQICEMGRLRRCTASP